MKDVLKKIQSWPDKKKRNFLWIVAVVLFLILLIFWYKIFASRLISLSTDELKSKYNVPELKMPDELTSSSNELFQELENISKENLPENFNLENINEEQK